MQTMTFDAQANSNTAVERSEVGLNTRSMDMENPTGGSSGRFQKRLEALKVAISPLMYTYKSQAVSMSGNNRYW